jgi:tRNA pseudouridine38-40 synthase
MQRTLRLTLEYDGGQFGGWARQPDRRTIEGTLGTALESLWPGAAETLAVAGRTDAGVHARHQVASVVVQGGPPLERAADALRSLLPRDLAVVSAEEAPAVFHARYSALARRYEYRVLARRPRSPLRAERVLHHASPVDRERLDRCAALVIGEHDFGAFTPIATPGARRLRHVTECAWRAADEELLLEIEADAFLHHMVRTLVGTMLEVGRHVRDLDSFESLLGGASRDLAGPTAPPHALTLTGVRYAGDVPGGDRIRCYVTRERDGVRELLVYEDGGPAVPVGDLAPGERVDLAAGRVVRGCTGLELAGVPRPLGIIRDRSAGHVERRTRAVWLQAPDDAGDRWLHGSVPCGFVALPAALPPEQTPQLERLVQALSRGVGRVARS